MAMNNAKELAIAVSESLAILASTQSDLLLKGTGFAFLIETWSKNWKGFTG
jgi:hypothetical protein